MNEWKDFYTSVRDPSWPECNQIEDFTALPAHIQLEIVRDHLFGRKNNISLDNIRHIDNNFPNFLNYIELVKKVIGPTRSLMNSQDVIFLYSIIWSKRPHNVLEIGRLHGWSTSIIFGALEDIGNGHLYTVDIEDATNSTIKKLLKSRTTFITASSKTILSLPELTNCKFEVVFIDGDHTYSAVLTDLKNCFKITTSEAWILLHDADMTEVQQAIEEFLSTVDNIADRGVYGEKIRLLYKRNTK